MKIAILTSGILPVPAVRGGAVENLIDFYLEYNEQHRLHDITVYSVADKAVKNHPALSAKLNHYHYINVNSLLAKIDKRIFHYVLHNYGYYHYSTEYFLQKAMRHVSRQHYDMIVLENRPAYSLKMLGRTSAPLVYHLHNEKLTPEVNKCQDIYGAATGIITVSDFIRKGVLSINPEDTKTQTVYNGIDLEAFKPQGTPDRTLLGLSDTDFVIVYSGRMNEQKGIRQLIEAMLQLKDYQDIKLLVIGGNFYGVSDNNDPFIQTLKQTSAPLQDRIIFTGFVPYSQMPAYLGLADIALVPSVWEEPFGLTCLEAMAVGLPLITTNKGGIPEVANPTCSVLLDTDAHFVDSMAQAILDLYHHPEKRKAMSQAALLHVRQFSKEHYAKNFFEALSHIR